MFRVKKEIKQAIKQQLIHKKLQFSHDIFLKTRSMVGSPSPYVDLDEKVLMQAKLQHTFSFKPAHG